MIKELLFSVLLSTSIAIGGASSNEFYGKIDFDYYQENTKDRALIDTYYYLQYEDLIPTVNPGALYYYEFYDVSPSEYLGTHTYLCYAHPVVAGSSVSFYNSDGSGAYLLDMYVTNIFIDQEFLLLQDYNDYTYWEGINERYNCLKDGKLYLYTHTDGLTYHMMLVNQVWFRDYESYTATWLGLNLNGGEIHYIIVDSIYNRTELLPNYPFYLWGKRYIETGYYFTVDTIDYLTWDTSYRYIKEPNMVAYEYNQYVWSGYSDDYDFQAFNLNLSFVGSALGSFDSEDEAYSTGYTNGYNDGIQVGEQSGSNLVNLFITIADIPMNIIHSMFNFDVLGISLFVAVLGLFSLAILLFVVRKVML